ncbi:uncharacterized protein LOC141633016 [Silene latifolia]|uniref:uncharacterized protein LOC141633016 n=1 Tax=Silene latifolia TaxID=37657 RepID=UPI003D774DFA
MVLAQGWEKLLEMREPVFVSEVIQFFATVRVDKSGETLTAKVNGKPLKLSQSDFATALDIPVGGYDKLPSETWVALPPFQYHPLCKNLKLTHLIFADDLLLFCKGKPKSIRLLMRAFSSFSNAFGLSMNHAKSEIFFNGVIEDIREGIKQVTGFREGTMPFRYLGVPIKAGRLTKQECSSLSENIVARIRGLGAKKLSYAGRITLINAVLNTLHNYWAQMFIIPKSIINRIIAICRNYLWDGSPDYHRVPLVAWDKWINDVYIKNQDWHNYSPPSDATWVWKHICKVKEKLKDGFIDSIRTSSSKGYTIKGGYEWLCPAHMTFNWSAIVWNNWNIPKHSLSTWLIMHEGMNVKIKLFRFGCCEDDLCVLCQRETKTVEHLFTSCIYTTRVQHHLLQWYGGSFPTVDSLIAENRNIIQWRIKVSMFNAFHYFIWFERNNTRINEWLLRPVAVARRIEEDTKRRVKQKFRAVDDQTVFLWLQSMGVI